MLIIQNCDNCGKLAITGTMPKHENKQYCGDCSAAVTGKDPVGTCMNMAMRYVADQHKEIIERMIEEHEKEIQESPDLNRMRNAQWN